LQSETKPNYVEFEAEEQAGRERIVKGVVVVIAEGTKGRLII